MLDPIDISPHVFYVVLLVCAASIPLNLWTFVNWNKSASKAIQASAAAILPQIDAAEVKVTKEPELPAGWWTDDSLFQLERRAIFSKVVCPTMCPGSVLTRAELALRQPPQSIYKAGRLHHI